MFLEKNKDKSIILTTKNNFFITHFFTPGDLISANGIIFIEKNKFCSGFMFSSK